MVEDAAGVFAQLPYGYLVAVLETTDVLLEFVVQAQLSLVHELKDHRDREGLGDASDAEAEVRLYRRTLF